MRVVQLKTAGDFSTVKLLNQICSGSPQGMTLPQMRSRIRVLDAVEAAGADAERVLLEDAEFATVTDAINTAQWMFASRDLLAIIDGVLASPVESKLRAVD